MPNTQHALDSKLIARRVDALVADTKFRVKRTFEILQASDCRLLDGEIRSSHSAVFVLAPPQAAQA